MEQMKTKPPPHLHATLCILFHTSTF
jgi:hypothetical protein